MSAPTKWMFEADFLQACNCDFGCPCEFSAPPTRGGCDGMGGWLINRGRFGDLSLDNLGLGYAARWPKAIHEGKGTACIFVDEKASPPQREALLQISSGKVGGLPFEIIVTTFTKILEPRFVPFEFKRNGRESSLRMGDSVLVTLGPILNPVTRQPETVRVEHPTGFLFKQAECVASREMKVAVGDLNYSWPNKAAFVAQVKYSN